MSKNVEKRNSPKRRKTSKNVEKRWKTLKNVRKRVWGNDAKWRWANFDKTCKNIENVEKRRKTQDLKTLKNVEKH